MSSINQLVSLNETLNNFFIYALACNLGDGSADLTKCLQLVNDYFIEKGKRDMTDVRHSDL